MKKIFILLLIVISFGLFADGISARAEILRDKFPDDYEAIKTRAVETWGSDHEMVVYEINKQVDAYFEIFTDKNRDEDVFNEALFKWADNIDAMIADPANMFSTPIDWEMVKWEYDKQVKAKNSY